MLLENAGIDETLNLFRAMERDGLRMVLGERSVTVRVDGADVRLLRDGAEAFPAMLAAIAAAAREIVLEFYWFAPDRISAQSESKRQQHSVNPSFAFVTPSTA